MVYVGLNLYLRDDRQALGIRLYGVHCNAHKTENGPFSLFIAVSRQLTASITCKVCSIFVGALNEMSVLHIQQSNMQLKIVLF